MADVFKLTGRVVIDASDANKALDKTAKNAKQSQAKISGSLDKIKTSYKTAFETAEKAGGKSLAQIASESGKTVNQLKSDVMKAASQYKASGMSMSEAMRKAYADIGYVSKSTTEQVADDAEQMASEFQAAGKKINISFEKLGKTFKATTKGIEKMGVALIKVGDVTERVGRTMARGIAIGTAAFGTAAATIGKNALDVRSSIEQGMGGTEAVFKQYAHIIKDESKDAWKNAGLSMEEYLATANKMGSLFKGAGFGEMQAAEMTVNAMQRAADVASIMGIDVSVAMEAIAGAAKGNFTMMDNLGVAMNDTTLEAYRLEKGFDKAVSQMTTAEKVELAMQMFMERTADYTGNYAKENETAAGSLQTLKAAWSNFLGGVGSFSDLEQSAFGYLRIAAKTMGLDSLVPMINGAQETVQRVAEILSMEGLDGRQKFAQIRRYLLEKSVNLANALGEKIPKGISSAASVISETLSDINVNLPHYLDVGKEIFKSVRDGVKQAAKSFTTTAAIVAPSVISGWFTAKTDFIKIGLDFLGELSDAIEKDLENPDGEVGKALQEGMQKVVDGLARNLPKMTNLAVAFFGSFADALSSVDENGLTFADKIEDIVDGIVNMFKALEPHIGKIVEAVMPLMTAIIKGIVDRLPDILQTAGSLVGEVAGTIIEEFGKNPEDYLTLLGLFGGYKGGKKLIGKGTSKGLDWIRKAIYPDSPTTPTLPTAPTTPTTSPVGGGGAVVAGSKFLNVLSALTPLAVLGTVTGLVSLADAESDKQIRERNARNRAAVEGYTTDDPVLAELQKNMENYHTDIGNGTYNPLALQRFMYAQYADVDENGRFLGWNQDKVNATNAALMANGYNWNLFNPFDPDAYGYRFDEGDQQKHINNIAEMFENTGNSTEAMGEQVTSTTEDVAVMGTTSSDAAANISEMGNAADNATEQLNNVRLPFIWEKDGAGFATGYSFVPRDNLPAYLHQGEAVLTAKEASEWRQYKNGGTNRLEMAVNNLISAISGINGDTNTNMNLYINKRHVASAMSRDMGRSIGNREYMLMRGMGG